MDSKGEDSSLILRLPNETLRAIFDHLGPRTGCPIPQSGNIRLTCKRFGDICKHHILRSSVTVDFSRPATLSLLHRMAQDKLIAGAITDVNLRLHFYHPWVAASIRNFTEVFMQQWDRQNRRLVFPEASWQAQEASVIPQHPGRVIAFEEVLQRFVNEIRAYLGYQHAYEYAETGRAPFPLPEFIRTLREAYILYKNAWQVQNDWMITGRFTSTLSAVLSKSPNVRHVKLYDMDPVVDYDHVGQKITIMNRDDKDRQKRSIIRFLFRPMLWGDAFWAEPREEIRAGTPTNLLFDIPIAMAGVQGFTLPHLSITLTMVADYMLLTENGDNLQKLSAAVDKMQLTQFTFNPRFQRYPRMWDISRSSGGGGARKVQEVAALRRYVSTYFQPGCISKAEYNLRELLKDKAMEALVMTEIPTSLELPVGIPSRLRSLVMREVWMTVASIRTVSQAVAPGGELEIYDLNLFGEQWVFAIDVFKENVRNLSKFRLRNPLNLEIARMKIAELGWDKYTFEPWPTMWDPSRAERYIMGEEGVPNPLQFAMNTNLTIPFGPDEEGGDDLVDMWQ